MRRAPGYNGAGADVAQLVEHQLPKLRVVGSSPIVRFEKPAKSESGRDSGPPGRFDRRRPWEDGERCPFDQGRSMVVRRFLVAACLTLVCLVSPAASYGLAGDEADGRGTTSGARFDFLADATGLTDRANGHFRHTFTSTDPNITISGDVTCMLIVGRVAFIGGRITSYKPSGAAGLFGFAQGFGIYAEDNAKPSNGLDRYGFTTRPLPPASCTEIQESFIFGQPVLTGDIDITPGGLG